ncbi:MAG: response regulator [Phycisphaerae bacterium]|nr:response regulator [Phycisphaerae bacterium]
MTRPIEHGEKEDAACPLVIVALDDDADFREYLRESLSAQGHDIRTAATPDEMTKAIESRMPNVLLLDMKMGRYSGEAVLAEVRTRWPRLCVIVVTGHPSMETMRETFKQDVFDYISKPFSMDEMRRVLAQAARSLGLGGAPHDRLRVELGKQIRLTRAERAWTLKELSEASNVSVSQLSSIERGAHLPSLESLVAIASALNATPSEWLRSAGF